MLGGKIEDRPGFGHFFARLIYLHSAFIAVIKSKLTLIRSACQLPGAILDQTRSCEAASRLAPLGGLRGTTNKFYSRRPAGPRPDALPLWTAGILFLAGLGAEGIRLAAPRQSDPALSAPPFLGQAAFRPSTSARLTSRLQWGHYTCWKR